MISEAKPIIYLFYIFTFKAAPPKCIQVLCTLFHWYSIHPFELQTRPICREIPYSNSVQKLSKSAHCQLRDYCSITMHCLIVDYDGTQGSVCFPTCKSSCTRKQYGCRWQGSSDRSTVFYMNISCHRWCIKLNLGRIIGHLVDLKDSTVWVSDTLKLCIVILLFPTSADPVLQRRYSQS